MRTDELRQELNQINFVTVITDASNRRRETCFHCGLPETDVRVKQLEVKKVSRESAEVLREYLFSALDQTRLKEKLIGFCADNCNTNFGNVKRKGQNKVFFKVKDNVKRNLVGIRCRVYIVHNCLQHAVDTLPI